jgi:flagellin
MKDLNTEINATAQRTSFNGINLLSSGASVDSVNSDLYAGQQLQMIGTTMAIVDGVATSVGVGLDTTGNISDGTTAGSEFNMSITDAFKQRMAGLTYTLSYAGSAFTITGTLDGQAVSQTVNLQTVVGTSSASERHTQTLDFSTFGTTIDLTTVTTTTGTVTGTSLASGLAAKLTMSLTGNTGTISDVKLSGASSGSYTLAATSSVSNVLTMSGTINGMATTQSLSLSTVSANTTTTFSFDSFGVSFDISAYGTNLSGINLANTLVTLNEGTQTASGTLVISTGQNSELQFQSGSTSDAYITIDTVNVMTGSSGNTAGASTEMKAVGTAITDTATSYLGGLNASNDISTWQAAFKAAEASIDTALDFISTQRGVYGSQMNRLSYVSTNLTSQSTNLQNSRSAIIDTDFAAETAKLTKGQIMQQAATAMLAQANQMPNVVLSLLK